ncbi:MAG TPA: hypothetical protein VHP35_10800 [Terriglobia bacterium]|jgi:hypothetical protein|nr:hypothetical protein [Terriglobia bacterium]
MKALVYHGPGKRALDDKPTRRIATPCEEYLAQSRPFFVMVCIVAPFCHGKDMCS